MLSDQVSIQSALIIEKIDISLEAPRLQLANISDGTITLLQ
jgi:hypothetical protein